jgi:hypothetical protein
MCERHEDNEMLDEPEEAQCRVCGCGTGEADFEDIDDEFNPRHPMCPQCQREARLRNQTCEFCDAPAAYETDAGPLCDDHHSDYVDGFVSRDD